MSSGQIIKNKILENKMQLLSIEDHKYSLFTVQAWVHAGSVNEEDSATGCAHMLEHLAFHGTSSRPGMATYYINDIGGIWNAFTSKEYTVYSITVPDEYSMQALNILIDIIFYPLLDLNTFENEKNIVISEIIQQESNPAIWIHNNLWALAFPNDPYGRSILGNHESIRSLSLDDIKKFHALYYTPSNTVLVLVGRLAIEDTADAVSKALIKSDFSETIKIAGREGISKFNKKNGRVVEYRKNLNQAHISIGLVIEPLSPNLYYTVRILESILFHEKVGRLKRFSDEQQFAMDINGGWQPMKNCSLITISSLVPQEKLEVMERKIKEEILKLSTNPPSEKDFNIAKIAVEKMHIVRTHRSRDVAYNIGLFEFLGSLDLFTKYKDYLETIRKDDITKFIENNVVDDVTSIILPEGS